MNNLPHGIFIKMNSPLLWLSSNWNSFLDVLLMMTKESKSQRRPFSPFLQTSHCSHGQYAESYPKNEWNLCSTISSFYWLKSKLKSSENSLELRRFDSEPYKVLKPDIWYHSANWHCDLCTPKLLTSYLKETHLKLTQLPALALVVPKQVKYASMPSKCLIELSSFASSKSECK